LLDRSLVLQIQLSAAVVYCLFLLKMIPMLGLGDYGSFSGVYMHLTGIQWDRGRQGFLGGLRLV
jgi:hypothetical protein